MNRFASFWTFFAVLGISLGSCSETAVSCTADGALGPSATDVDGNVYQTVVIGGQAWMQSNLLAKRYNNGDSIPTGLSTGVDSAWATATSGAYVAPPDSLSGLGIGLFYNHLAVTDSRGICPAGFRIPDTTDWNNLIECLGGVNTAGGKIKSTGPEWLSPNTGATNSSGFTLLPVLYASSFGVFSPALMGSNGFIWSANRRPDNNQPIAFFAKYSDAQIDRFYNTEPEGQVGIPCRCVKDL